MSETETDPRFLELELVDAKSETRARVAPGRGGMATALEVASRPIFFLDEETFLDPKKNVRGGSPVLFPTPGKLAGDRWSRDGAQGALGQHGFARNLPWAVVRSDASSVVLRLSSTEATRASYPWDFSLELAYRVDDRTLFVAATVENRSPTPMPFGLGFHPYFAIRDKRAFTIASSATRAFDNVRKQEVAFDARALDVRTEEIDLHLLDHGERAMTFTLDAGTRVTIDGGTERPHWVLWSLPGRDFVCVEPWTCPGNAMNTGERLVHLAPGETHALRFWYRVEKG